MKALKLKPQSKKLVNKWAAILIAFVCIANLSCNKDDDSTNNTSNTSTDIYYVKYIVSSSTIYTGGKMNLTVVNEKNQDLNTIINQNGGSSTIIGPVSKGFNAKLKAIAVGNTFNKLKLNAEIQVSKNNGPFAIKATNESESPRDQIELAYSIDY